MSKNKKIPFSYSHFGVNDYDFWFHLKSLEETELLFKYGSKLISDAGMHWDRVHLPGIFSWNVIEPVKGKYDWTIPDLLVKTAQSYNINLLPNLWLFTAWDQKAWKGTWRKKIDISATMGTEYVVDDSCPIPPRYDRPHDLNAYSKWITTMVERYDGDGVDDMPGLKYPIKYWEPMNEVWGTIFWVPAPVTSHKSFAEMTKITYLAAKKADPECKIVLANAFQQFYRAIMELGNRDGQQYFDVINLHGGYRLDRPGFGLPRQIESIKRLMDEYDVKASIWFTEFNTGWTKLGSFPRPETVQIPFGDETGKMPYAKPFIQEAMPPRDPPPGSPPQPKRQEGSTPPAVYLRRQATNLIKGLTEAFYNGTERIFFLGLGPIRPSGAKLTEPKPESYGNYSLGCMLDPEGKPRLVYYTAHLFMSKLDMFKTIEKLDLGKDVKAYKYILDTELNPESEFLYVLWSDTGSSATLTGLENSFITITGTVPRNDKDGNVFFGPASGPEFNVRCIKVDGGKVNLKLSEEPIIVEP